MHRSIVYTHYMTQGFEMITAAAALSAEAHKEQTRRELNEPYSIHPARVAAMAAKIGCSYEYICAAYLHDVPEDTKFPIETIRVMFGDKVYTFVRVLTKWWGSDTSLTPLAVALNKELYYKQILLTPGAPTLKVLDRIDNLRDFERVARMGVAGGHARAAKYVVKTKEEFPPLLDVVTSEWVRKEYTNALNALELAVTVFDNSPRELA